MIRLKTCPALKKRIGKRCGINWFAILILLAAFLLGPRLASYFYSNIGLILVNQAFTSSSKEQVQQQAATAESILQSAVQIDGNNRGALRAQGVSYSLLKRPNDALLAWHAGVAKEQRLTWERNIWYRQGTALEPGLNRDLANWSTVDGLILDSFASPVNWLSCSWCENTQGTIEAINGELKVSFRNLATGTRSLWNRLLV